MEDLFNEGALIAGSGSHFPRGTFIGALQLDR